MFCRRLQNRLFIFLALGNGNALGISLSRNMFILQDETFSTPAVHRFFVHTLLCPGTAKRCSHITIHRRFKLQSANGSNY